MAFITFINPHFRASPAAQTIPGRSTLRDDKALRCDNGFLNCQPPTSEAGLTFRRRKKLPALDLIHVQDEPFVVLSDKWKWNKSRWMQ